MRAVAALLILSVFSCGNPKNRISPSQVDDTAIPTNGFVAIGTNNLDADGNTSTCWDLGTPSVRTLAFSSDAPVHSLSIVSSLEIADGSISNGIASVSYSTDGGKTFQAIWSKSGAIGRPLTTDAITLHGESARQVQVRFSATMPPKHFKGCEVWLEP